MSGNREVFAEEARASTRTAGGQRLYEERATDLEATVQQQTQSPLFRRQTRVNARQSEKAEARQEKRLAAAGAQDHRRQLNTPPPVCILATAAPSNAASNVSDQAPHGSCASWTTAGCMLPTRSDATTQYDVAVTTKSTACSNLGKETKATQCFPVKVSTGSQTTDLRRIRVAISRRGKESTKTVASTSSSVGGEDKSAKQRARNAERMRLKRAADAELRAREAAAKRQRRAKDPEVRAKDAAYQRQRRAENAEVRAREARRAANPRVKRREAETKRQRRAADLAGARERERAARAATRSQVQR
ncbi:uncharacterized protein LOC144158527 isoform X4 [Haemaphysalis longicornis]